MNAEEKRDLNLFWLDFKEFRKDVYQKFEDIQKDISDFKTSEAIISASHMTREDCQAQEAVQNTAIDELKATVNRGLGVIGLILALPAFIGALWGILQIIKYVGG